MPSLIVIKLKFYHSFLVTNTQASVHDGYEETRMESTVLHSMMWSLPGENTAPLSMMTYDMMDMNTDPVSVTELLSTVNCLLWCGLQ